MTKQNTVSAKHGSAIFNPETQRRLREYDPLNRLKKNSPTSQGSNLFKSLQAHNPSAHLNGNEKQASQWIVNSTGTYAAHDYGPFADFNKRFQEALQAERERYKKASLTFPEDDDDVVPVLSKKAHDEIVQNLMNTEWLNSEPAQWKTYVKLAMNAVTRSQRERYIKLASDAMGNATDVEFETALAQLAMLYLKDKAPRLFDYLVGFRTLDKSDDNTKAASIFGFKIGSEWVYVPVFFLNGELKGHEIMYLYNKDQFRPLKENWINTLIRKKPVTIGSPDLKNIGDIGTRYPDMRQITEPPPLGKLASVRNIEDVAVMRQAQDKLEALSAQRKRALHERDEIKKAAEHTPALLDMPEWVQRGVIGFSKIAAAQIQQANCDLKQICGNDFRIFRKLAFACDYYPVIKRSLDTLYGEDFFPKTWEHLYSNLQKTAKAEYPNTLNKRHSDQLGNLLAGEPKFKAIEKRYTPKSDVPVKVLLGLKEDDSNAHSYLKEEQVGRLIEGKPVTLDYRNKDEIAVVRDKISFRSPDRTGVYKVFMANGQYRECLVIIAPIGEQKGLERCLVIDWKRKEALRTKARNVLCIDEPYNEDWFDRLPADEFKSGTSLQRGGGEKDFFNSRIFIGKDGRGTLPLEGRRTNDQADTGIWSIRNSSDTCSSMDISGDAAYKPYAHIVTERMIHTVMTQHPQSSELLHRKGNLPDVLIARKEVGGKTFVIRENKLYLPQVFKYCDIEWSRGQTMALASENDVKYLVYKTHRQLKGVKVAAQKYVLDHAEPKSYGEAFKTLVCDYDFREKTAEEILSTLDLIPQGRAIEIPYQLPLKKTADIYSNTPSPSNNLLDSKDNVLSPTFQEPPTGADPWTNVTTQMPYSDVQQLGYEGQPNPLAQTADAPPPPDPLAMQSAQSAAMNQQKDVFDTSILAGLLKNDRNDDLLRDYSKIFKQALDRFGRLLFKFYWDREAFAERFGEDKLQSFEDSLKDSVDKVGDLCLFIEEKDERPTISDLFGSATLGTPQDAG
jgi:hypothetical protein